MADVGYSDLRLTIQWQGGPEIANATQIAGAVACAKERGIRPIVAVYSKDPAALGNNAAAQDAFAGFVATVGSTMGDARRPTGT